MTTRLATQYDRERERKRVQTIPIEGMLAHAKQPESVAVKFAASHTLNDSATRTGGRSVPSNRPRCYINRSQGVQAENNPKRPVSPQAKLRRDYAGFTRIGGAKFHVGEGAYWLACRNAGQSQRKATRSLVEASEEKRAYARNKPSR